MATKTKNFSLFGVNYRTTQFTAVDALAIMDSPATHPIENLRLTQALDASEGWLSLDSKQAINRLVVDASMIVPPRIVLQKLLYEVNNFSFGFTNGWKGVKIPARFRSGVDSPKSSSHLDPMIAQLIQDGVAKLKELEEYYSLEDAFAMFDIMVAKGVNEALANEAASKKR